VKNGAERYVVLNRTAKSVTDARRGEHADFVFTCVAFMATLTIGCNSLLRASDPAPA